MSNQVFVELIEILEDMYGHINQETLAKHLGVAQGTISNWRNGASPRKASLKKILNLYRDHHTNALVQPILEFKAIRPHKKNNSWSLATDKSSSSEFRRELEGHKGLYLFYDSAGKVIYLGKSERCLYVEIKQRLNAEANRPFYGPTKQPNPRMGDIANYISAYEVTVPKAIKNLESFLLRSFANDIMNKNSGNFKVLFEKS